MQLFDFFTCCFSTTTVKDPPTKTYYELLFENESQRFKSFSGVEGKNSNIENYYYIRDKYNDVLKDINNTQESLWKSRILTYTIHGKQVFMYYDPYKMGFTYYSSEALSYDLLNIIAMKYVRVFHCYDFFMDNKKTYFYDDGNDDDVENNKEQQEDETQQENNAPTSLYRVHYIEVDKKNTPLTKGPFAKFKKGKSNTPDNKNKDTHDSIKDKKDVHIISRCKNKFIHSGNLYNFELLKKQKTVSGFRSPVIDNMKEFSYKEFKSLQK